MRTRNRTWTKKIKGGTVGKTKHIDSVHRWCTEWIDTVYTRAEVHKAKTAYEFLKCSGYPSPEEAVHLIQDGNV